MALTRKQTATVSFPWTTLTFQTIEPRPTHKPVMKEAHETVEVRTPDGTIFRWFSNGDVQRKEVFGRTTWWWVAPTIGDAVTGETGLVDGTFCQFHPGGEITLARHGLTFYWGKHNLLRDHVVGSMCILPCECDACWADECFCDSCDDSNSHLPCIRCRS